MSEYASELSESLCFYQNKKLKLSQLVWPQTNQITEMIHFMKETKIFKVETSAKETEIEVQMDLDTEAVIEAALTVFTFQIHKYKQNFPQNTFQKEQKSFKIIKDWTGNVLHSFDFQTQSASELTI